MTIRQTAREQADLALAYKTEKRSHSPVEQLREALDKADRQIVSLDGNNVEEFLVLLDRIEQMFVDLAASEDELRGEAGRWESLQSRILTKPDPIPAAAAKRGGLPSLAALHPPAAGFWWHLDAEVRRRRGQAIKRFVLTSSSVVLVLVTLLWGVDYFFPPDPATILVSNTTSAVEQLAMESKWGEALVQVQAARQTLPDEPELLVWEAVLYEQLGETDAAQASLTRAQSLTPDQPVGLWIMVAMKRFQVNNLDGAEAAIQEALASNPDDAQSHFWLANIAEARGDQRLAIELFTQTSELARAADDPQLEVMAKFRMGMLMQQANPFASSPVTTTAPLTTTETVTTPAAP